MRFNKLQAFATALIAALALAPAGIVKADDYSAAPPVAAFGVLAGLGGVLLIFFFVSIAAFVFWVVMLIDALQRKNWQDESQKNLWLILLIVSFFVGFSFVVALVYYFVIRKPLGKDTMVADEAEVVADKPTKKKK